MPGEKSDSRCPADCHPVYHFQVPTDLLLETQQSVYLRFQYIDVERLGEIVVRTRSQGDHAAIRVGQRGDDDDGRAPEEGVRSQQPAQLKTVQFGHHQVDQEDIRLYEIRHIHCGGAAIHSLRVEAHPHERRFVKIREILVVVDDHDPWHTGILLLLNIFARHFAAHDPEAVFREIE